jgi:hypothetical protein
MNHPSKAEPCPRSFIVFGDARTGTSMLRSLLNAHPDIQCLGEYISNDVHTIFSSALPHRLSPLARPIVTSAWFKRRRVRRLLAKPPHHLRYGFKVLYEHLPESLVPEIFSRVQSHVLILRRDHVRRALSLLRARATGQWNMVCNRSVSTPRRDAVYVDFKELSTMIERTEQLDARWEQHFGALGSCSLTITYEELVRDRTKTLREVFRFLGVGESPAFTIAPETVRMSSPTPLSESITNFDELLHQASGTPFAGMLRDFERPLA